MLFRSLAYCSYIMIKEKTSKRKPSKHNRKVKRIDQDETGELVRVNANSRNPIICLPEIVTNPVLSTYRRFICTSAVSGSISIADLLNQFMVATTSVLANSILYAIRLKKIRALCPVTTQGTSVFCSMIPIAGDTSNNSFSAVPETYIDTSSSIDVPAYLHLTPSIKTPFGSWHFSNTTSSNLLLVQFPTGTCVDILFEYLLRPSNASASTYTRAIAAGTAGKLYAAAILTNMIPQGVEYI